LTPNFTLNVVPTVAPSAGSRIRVCCAGSLMLAQPEITSVAVKQVASAKRREKREEKSVVMMIFNIWVHGYKACTSV
jgi:hypothetical protein